MSKLVGREKRVSGLVFRVLGLAGHVGFKAVFVAVQGLVWALGIGCLEFGEGLKGSRCVMHYRAFQGSAHAYIKVGRRIET